MLTSYEGSNPSLMAPSFLKKALNVKLQDLPYSPKYTSEDVQAARQWLLDNRGHGSNGVYALFEDGKKIYSQISDACHGGLNRITYDSSRLKKAGPSILATLTHDPKFTNCGRLYRSSVQDVRNMNSEAVSLWYSWLLEKSPFKRFILETSLEQALESGLLLSCDLPNNLLLSICILSRHQREWHGHVVGWAELVRDHGFDPNLAFILVWGLSLYGAKAVEGKAVQQRAVYPASYGHSIVSSPTDVWVQNFLREEVSLVKKPYRESKSYSGVCALFGPSDSLASAMASFVKKLKDLDKGVPTNTSAPPPNPFGKKFEEAKAYDPYGYCMSKETTTFEVFLRHAKEAARILWGV